MRMYRFVIALLILAALVIPQATPAQSAPLNAEETINLKPGDTVTINCPTRLIQKSVSHTKWRLLCRLGAAAPKATATPILATIVPHSSITATHTPVPTTATQTPASTATQSSVFITMLLPRDTVTINCPTRLIQQSASHTKLKLLCRQVAATATATVTATDTATSAVTSTATATLAQSSEPTAIESSVSTATQIVAPTATRTSAPTVTLSPVATATKGTDGLIQPFKTAPACPTHASNKWHGLWDYKRGCHYDHTHGDDPALADKYLGEFGKLWGGQTISYPFSTGVIENTMKHAGYKISVRMPGYHPHPPCGTFDRTDITGESSDACVVASRVEYHAVGSTMALIGRYHSYYMELYTCRPPYRQPQDCGIVRVGGWADFAQLQAPHYSTRIVRPGGTIDFGDGMVMTYSGDGPDLPSRSGEPYVFSIPYTEENLARYRRNPPSLLDPGTTPGSIKATIDQWSMNDWDCGDAQPAGDPCHNPHARVMFQVGDSFTLVDTQNLNNVRWICYGEPECEYNGSLIGLNEIAVRVLQAWQPGGNGFVTFNGYTDRWGNPRFDSICNTVSVDCVPFVLERAPVGVAASASNYGCRCDVWEYDIYFNNKPSGWIKHPN